MELTPDFSISINGSNTFPKERVISIRTTDETGIVSDSCEIELDDFDRALQFPNTEAKVEVSLGYKETGLTKIGTYFVLMEQDTLFEFSATQHQKPCARKEQKRMKERLKINFRKWEQSLILIQKFLMT